MVCRVKRVQPVAVIIDFVRIFQRFVKNAVHCRAERILCPEKIQVNLDF